MKNHGKQYLRERKERLEDLYNDAGESQPLDTKTKALIALLVIGLVFYFAFSYIYGLEVK